MTSTGIFRRLLSSTACSSRLFLAVTQYLARGSTVAAKHDVRAVTSSVASFFSRLERKGRSIVPTDSLPRVLHKLELCHVCKASRNSSCPRSCNSSLHGDDTLGLVRAKDTAKTTPNPACWLQPYQRTSSCSRLIAHPRASQLMHYEALVRAAKDAPLLSSTLVKPLVFMGDSLAEQMFWAAQCQAIRTGRSPDRIQLISSKHFNDRRTNRSRWDRSLERLGMLPLSERGLFRKVAQRGGGTIAVCIGMHYNDAAMNEMAQTAHVLEGKRQLSRTDYQDDIDVITQLLEDFASSCAECHAVIVSAPLQHFPTIDGSFSPQVMQDANRSWESIGAGCVPIRENSTNGSSPNSWRSADVLERLMRTSNITFIPWHSLTLEWWDTHPGLSETSWRGNPVRSIDHKLMLDCSHHCYTPFLYEPLWWALDQLQVSG